METEKIETIIGYTFKDKGILEMALTHTSYGNLHKTGNYQRLEFLGDSILDFIVAEELFSRHPHYNEGKLSKFRSAVVNKNVLSKIAESMQLVQFLRANEVSEKIKSDIFESVVGAIYLDCKKIDEVRRFILKQLKDELCAEFFDCDYKTILKEHCEKDKEKLVYIDLGMNDGRTHTIRLSFGGQVLAECSAQSKAEAEAECAKLAVIELGILTKEDIANRLSQE